MYKNYIKTAFRNIKRYKGYSFINIAGLTVGMGCFILIFLWVYDELNYDTFHTHSNQLYRIILKKADDPGDPGIPSAPYILPKILKEEYPEIVEVNRVRTRAYPSAVRHGPIHPLRIIRDTIPISARSLRQVADSPFIYPR